MSLIITIIELIIVLSVVAVVHEFGHFLIAKLFKMTVNEFSIGFGKALWQKEYKGTKYSFRLILLGGYVALEGEEGDSKDKNAFSNKPPYQRILVLVAGVVFNFILAILILLGINFSTDTYTTTLKGLNENSVLYTAGLRDGDTILNVGNRRTHIYQDLLLYTDTSSNDVEVKYKSNNEIKETIAKDVVKTKGLIGVYFKSNTINDDGTLMANIDIIEPGSAAEKAGIKADDRIVSVNNETVQNSSDVIALVSKHAEEEIEIVVLRNDKEVSLKIIPSKVQYVDLGVTDVEIEKTTLAYSWYKSMNTVIRVVDSYIDLFKGKVKLNQMSGIVGVGEMISRTEGIVELLSLLATISLAIGAANIMPFPPLDGGKVVLVAVEWITRKKVSPKLEMILSYIGFGLLIALTIYVTIKDIIRVI